MARQGLPLSVATLVFSLCVGCQNPWRSRDYAQPDSLSDFPSPVAEYPDESPSESEASDETTIVDSLREGAAVIREATDPQTPHDRKTSLLEKATGIYSSVLGRDRDNAVAHHRLAVIADLKENYEGAEEHYQRALQATPHNPDVLNDYGYSCQLRGLAGESEKYYRRALDINPSHKRAASNLGQLLAKNGDYDNARAMLRRIGNPDHVAQVLNHYFPNGRPGEKADAVVVAAETTPQAEPARLPDATLDELFSDSPSLNETPVTTVSEPATPKGAAIGPGGFESSPAPSPPVDDLVIAARERVRVAQEELNRQFEDLDSDGAVANRRVTPPAGIVAKTNPPAAATELPQWPLGGSTSSPAPASGAVQIRRVQVSEQELMKEAPWNIRATPTHNSGSGGPPQYPHSQKGAAPNDRGRTAPPVPAPATRTVSTIPDYPRATGAPQGVPETTTTPTPAIYPQRSGRSSKVEADGLPKITPKSR